MFPTPTMTLADQILGIVGIFLKILGAEACRLRIGVRSIAIWNRVRRLERRFVTLYGQWKAGTLPQARVRASASAAVKGLDRGERREAPSESVASTVCPASLLPRAVGWMYKMLPLSAGTLRSHLEPLIVEHPEMKAFVAGCPQVGRVLRPLCTMVGTRPPAWLALAKRKRPPPQPSPARAGEGEVRARRRRPAMPRRRDFADPRDEARAWMRWSDATGKPVDPKKMSAAGFGCVLHWQRDGNCPPPEIGYGGRLFPPLPKDYEWPKD